MSPHSARPTATHMYSTETCNKHNVTRITCITDHQTVMPHDHTVLVLLLVTSKQNPSLPSFSVHSFPWISLVSITISRLSSYIPLVTQLFFQLKKPLPLPISVTWQVAHGENCAVAANLCSGHLKAFCRSAAFAFFFFRACRRQLQ